MIEQSYSNHKSDKELIAAVRGFLQGRHKFFCDLLRTQLAIAGLSQTDLASALTVDGSTVSNWLSSKRMPDAKLVYDCCIALKLNKKRQEMLVVAYCSAQLAKDLLDIIDRSLERDNNLASTAEVTRNLLGKFFSNIDSED